MRSGAGIVKHLIHHPFTGLIGGIVGSVIAAVVFGPGPMPRLVPRRTLTGEPMPDTVAALHRSRSGR